MISIETGYLIASRQELSMPPTIAIDQIKGSSLFMINTLHR